MLTCTVPSSTKPTKFYWLFNGRELTSDITKRVYIPEVVHKESEFQLQLQLNPPVPQLDTGTYTCIAEYECGKIERHFNIRFNIPSKQ